MNRKKLLASRYTQKAIVLVMLCLLYSFFLGCSSPESDVPEYTQTATGRYIAGRSGEDLILVEEGYSGLAVAVMGNMTGDADVFEGFKTGDRIRIVNDNFRETSPMQTQVYACEWLEAGTIDDIPAEFVESLTQRGWMDEPIDVIFEQNINGQKVQIRAQVRALWGHSIKQYYLTEPFEGCGLSLRSVNDPEVELTVYYYPDGFGICGTGVTSKEVTFDSGLSATYHTEEHGDGGVSAYIFFDDLDGTYVAHYRLNSEQREQYEDVIVEILNTVQISIQ